jgi:2-keto-4-pentenoate hydratase/2-oxohepta-3-ene-1,7-dioic acid hydratase in catechol pathway
MTQFPASQPPTSGATAGVPSSARVVRFDVVGAGEREVVVRYALNGGYAGRDTEQVQHHVDELAALGVPAPSRVPTLYPLSAVNVSQADAVQVPHDRTSGEAEWALVVGDGPDDLLLTAACDHTDRALEVHGVAWSKQSAPDLLGDVAWPLQDVAGDLDSFTLRAWVRHGESEQLIQDGTLAQLLPPSYWVDRLREAGLLRPGSVVLSGTIPMVEGVDQFADGWRVELADGAGNVSRVAYTLEQLPPAWD